MLKHPVLKHFAVLLALAGLLAIVRLFLSFQGGPFGAGDPLVSLRAAILYAPGWIYWLLPVAAGIAAGTGVGADHFKASVVTVGVTLVLMIGCDLLLKPMGQRRAVTAALESPQSWPMPRDTIPRKSPEELRGALRTSFTLLRGDRPAAMDGSELTLRQLRGSRAFSIFDVSMLLFPLITVGIMVGIRSWLAERVRFETPRDRLVMLWVASWLVVPLVWWLPYWWAGRRGFGIYFGGGSLLLVVLPTLLLLPLALLGWWRGFRSWSSGDTRALPKTISSGG